MLGQRVFQTATMSSLDGAHERPAHASTRVRRSSYGSPARSAGDEACRSWASRGLVAIFRALGAAVRELANCRRFRCTTTPSTSNTQRLRHINNGGLISRCNFSAAATTCSSKISSRCAGSRYRTTLHTD